MRRIRRTPYFHHMEQGLMRNRFLPLAMALHASTSAVLPPNMPTASGADAQRQLWTGMMSQMRVTLTSTPVTIAGQGDLAYVVGNYHVVSTMKDTTQAAPPPDDGKFLNVLQRQSDGSWKYVAESWSSNAEPPAPAPPPARRR
jgi:ketosteroid isomerase-like protein